MKNFIYLFMTLAAFTLSGCSKDDDSTGTPVADDDIDVVDDDTNDTEDDSEDTDDAGELTGDSETFNLQSVLDPDVSGTATFKKHESGASTIEINLVGTSPGTYPAHIHFESVAEGGDLAITLTNVDGDTGVSSTLVSTFNDGTPITYEELVVLDGYINVYRTTDFDGYIAQGDIGINQLTGESKAYHLHSTTADGIEGTVTIHQRISGAALVKIELEGTSSENIYPAYIRSESVAEGGSIVVALESVNGGSKKSETHIEKLNDETLVTYEDLLEFDGHIKIHPSSTEIGTAVVSEGDIGENALTGESVTYILNTVTEDAIDGTATIHERVSGAALVEIKLDGTISENLYPAHIHFNSAEEGGGIAVNLDAIYGGPGTSTTHLEMLNDDTPITYDELLVYDGHINVHLSEAEMGTIVSQGNIGINATD